jgi:RHS repeat-associated protein
MLFAVLLPLQETAFAQSGNVEFREISEPANIINRTTYPVSGTQVSTSVALSPTLGYRFTHWTVDGVRANDLTGRAANPASFTIIRRSDAIAHYLPENQDTDADGLVDAFEIEYFGDLVQTPTNDPDGDGYDIATELASGQHPLVFDQRVEGGVSRRRSPFLQIGEPEIDLDLDIDGDGFKRSVEAFRGYSETTFDLLEEGGVSRRRSDMKQVVLNPAYAYLVEDSDPLGLVAKRSPVLNGSTVLLSTAPDPSIGYRYTGWFSGGVRLGRHMQNQPIPIVVNGPTTATARYIAENADTDGDGLADWMEWYNFDTLTNGPADDPDGDGFSTGLEIFCDYVPSVFDDPAAGGISRRRSVMTDVDLSGNVICRVVSAPPGIINHTLRGAPGTTLTTPDLNGSTYLTYRFTHWDLDGMRQTDLAGVSVTRFSFTANTATSVTATAHYVESSADADSDGLPDWYEFVSFGTTTQGADDDSDGDGMMLGDEYRLGYSPRVLDKLAAGGVSRRRSLLAAVNHDVYAPGDPTDLRFDATEANPVLRWIPPPDTDGDLAGLRVYLTNGVTALSPTVTSLRLYGLARATSYVCRVTAFDFDGNESKGAFVTGFTWLDNPTNVLAIPSPGRVQLTWDPVGPAFCVKRYAIYRSEAPFTSVAGLTACATASGRSVSVSGLQNNHQYYFAVVTVNKSDGFDSQVTNVSATPELDTLGPTVTNVWFGGVVVSNGMLIEAAGELRASATDPAGVSRVEFWAGDNRIGSVVGGGPLYTVSWNADETVNGPLDLLTKAYDAYGNLTVVSNLVEVRIPVPADIPVITQPTEGAGFSRSPVRVSGHVEGHAKEVVVFVGGTTGAVASVSMDRTFTTFVPLTEGTNFVRAAARNLAGLGPASAPVVVILDSSLPSIPLRLVASSREGGEVRLTWWQPSGGTVVGYHVFRSATPFSETSEATRVSSDLVSSADYVDLPPADGSWYYRVVAVNRVGTWSALSEQVEATSDRTPPSGTLTYSTTGARVGDRFGPGSVSVLLETTEAPETTPFLTLTRTNGTPLAVSLTRTGSTNYEGQVAIEPTLGTLDLYATFSARDAVGNRGTEITQGGHIIADTEGPDAQITLEPVAPIPNDLPGPNEVRVALLFVTNDVPAVPPTLSYTLSRVQTSAVPLVLAVSNAWTYTTKITLPAGAGATNELLDLRYTGLDELGNTGAVIRGWTPVDVYRGTLPALAAPSRLQAALGLKGRVDLTWDSVGGALGYAVHRRAPGASVLSPLTLVSSNGYSDLPPEGQNSYAVATVRSAHGQVVTGELSTVVSVTTDSTPPAVPQGLAAVAWPGGVAFTWAAVSDSGPVRYLLYRNTLPVTNPAALTPIIANIVSTQALDTAPMPGGVYYAVTAMDTTSNESAPSASAYLNLSLLPVRNIAVEKNGTALPVLTWQHAALAQIDGYHVYLGSGAAAHKLHAGTLSVASNTLVDATYDNSNRLYAVAAVDDVAGDLRESLRREILLPAMDLAPVTNEPLRRGVMNQVLYRVTNRSGVPLGETRIGLLVAGHPHWSDPFWLATNEVREVALTVGGYRDLPSVGTATNTIWIHPADNEDVRIHNSQPFTSVNDSLSLTAFGANFVRGGWGQCRFELVNTCAETIEVITARGNGSYDSPDVGFTLETADGMVYATVPLWQNTGAGVVTLPGGESVARLAPGERFTCAPVAIAVPSAVANEAVLRVNIARLHHAVGTESQVTIEGLQAYTTVNLVDTPYTVTLTNMSPTTTVGTNPVHLAGQAIRRAGGVPEPNVPVRLVLTRDGFERTYTVYADASGNWSYDFLPLSTEHGFYAVHVIHPDSRERPAQGQFLIQQVWLDPKTGSVSIPRQYDQGVWVDMWTGEGTVLPNARVVFRAEDQPGGALPAGVTVNLPPAVNVPGSGHQRFNVTLRAATNAAQSVQLVLRVLSDTPAPGDWGTLTLNCNFWVGADGSGSGGVAAPVLAWTPGYVEAGVAVSNVAGASVELRNVGYVNMQDVRLALVDTNGAPAPAWVILNAATNQGSLAVGERRPISLTFAPDGAVEPRPQVPYEYRLRVWASNHPTNEVPLFVYVDNSGQGHASFHIMDIYTGTLDGNGQPIAGLAGATIELTREDSGLAFTTTAVSDALGEARVRDLPAGRYRVRISARNHNDKQDRIWIQPGVTLGCSYTLESPLITVEWSVEETTIQDQYEIMLSATYQTDVPAAVVVIEPRSVTIPDMQVGEVFNGEFSVKNYGLICAENVSMEQATVDEFYKFELLAPLPSTLDAKQVIRVPYRITCLKQGEGSDDGGGCWVYSICHIVSYSYKCINGQWVWGADGFCTSRLIGQCQSVVGVGVEYWGAGGVGGGGGWGGGGGGGGGTVQGTICAPRIDTDDPCKQEATSEPAGSLVDLLGGDYRDQVEDMSLKVKGHTPSIIRSYYRGKWHFNIDNQNLILKHESAGNAALLTSIIASEVEYPKADEAGTVFTFADRTIYATTNGFRRVDASGDWMRYGPDGKLLEYGDKYNRKVMLGYDGNGYVNALFDHFTNQIFWVAREGARITEVRDEAVGGRSVSYAYDGNGNLTTAITLLGGTNTYQYDGNNRLVFKRNPSGKESHITYNAQNYVTSVLDESDGGKFFEYDYDTSKQEYYAFVRTTEGNVYERWFDRNGTEIRRTVNGVAPPAPPADPTSYERDAVGNITRIVYADGATVTRAYDPVFNTLIEEVDELGVVTRYQYDAHGSLTNRTEAFGTDHARVTQWAYDALGQLVRLVRKGDSNTLDAVTQWTHDQWGNQSTVTDPEGYVTSKTYDRFANVLKTTDACGYTSSNTYDATGNPMAHYSPLGYATSNTYDQAGRLVTSFDPYGLATANEYDTSGQVIRRTDPDGRVFIYDYDQAGRLIRERDSDGNDNGTQFDANGRESTTWKVAGRVTRYSRDQFGRLVEVAEPDGQRTTFVYDERGYLVELTSHEHVQHFVHNARGQVVETVDCLGDEVRTNSVSYDKKGRLTLSLSAVGAMEAQTRDELGQVTELVVGCVQTNRFEYDARGNRVKSTDGLGNITSYQYDRNNRLVTKTYSDGSAESYASDPMGHLLVKAYPKGNRLEFAYDGHGQMIAKHTYDSITNTVPSRSIYTEYDRLGRVTNRSDGVYSESFAIDDAARIIEHAVAYGSFEARTSASYDSRNRIVRYEVPSGSVQTYSYDVDGRLAGVNLGGVGDISIESDDLSRPTRITYPNGMTRAFSYGLGGVTSAVVSASNGGLSFYLFYSTDTNRRLTGLDAGDGQERFEYDSRANVVRVVQPDGGELRYAYDAAGNLVSNQLSDAMWRYNSLGQLTSTGDTTLEYDANGNLIRRVAASGSREYVYNAGNELTAIIDDETNNVATYAYGPDGSRVKKTVGTIETFFFTGEAGLVAEFDSQGTIRRDYGYIPNNQWGGNPLFVREGSQYNYYCNDAFGSPRSLVAGNGVVSWKADYDIFGDAEVSTELVQNPLRAEQGYGDRESGLILMNARYYAPMLGRYVQRNSPYQRASAYVMPNESTPTGISQSDRDMRRDKGSYCGPGWCNNKEQTESNCFKCDNKWVPPLDVVDGACLEHDRCLGEGRGHIWCDALMCGRLNANPQPLDWYWHKMRILFCLQGPCIYFHDERCLPTNWGNNRAIP